MDKFIRTLLAGYIKSIKVSTNVGEFEFKDPLAESPPGVTDKAMAALQPALTIQVYDQKPLVIAPHGMPSPQKREAAQTIAVVGGVGIGALILLALLKRK